MLSWQKEIMMSLNDSGARLLDKDRYCLIGFHGTGVVLNLIPLKNDYTATELIKLQKTYSDLGLSLVHVWEDVWRSRRKQVLGKVQAMLGLNKRVHARKTTVQRISQPQADIFLEENHLQRSARARYKLALLHNEMIVAVACFSNLRLMKTDTGYRSAEVIRFASATGYTVIGGFSKLLKHFITQHRPDDVMSYADRDWSLGNAYEQAGFKLAAVTPPLDIYVDQDTLIRYVGHRLRDFKAHLAGVNCQAAAEGNFVKIFNTGNLKYILQL